MAQRSKEISPIEKFNRRNSVASAIFVQALLVDVFLRMNHKRGPILGGFTMWLDGRIAMKTVGR